jgi:hypothetical protein
VLSEHGAAGAQRALDRGIRYLLEAQEDSGAWIDFELETTPSDAWVTAYVGLALRAAAPWTRRDADTALRAAREFLLGSYPERRGWGFNLHAPIDGDSTAIATLFLAGEGGAPAGAYDSLRKHRQPDGGYSCYVRFTDASTWSSHVDVSAMALKALLTERPRDAQSIERCVDYLRAARLPDGSWPSFWYSTRVYSVVHVLDALGRYEPALPAACDAREAADFALRAAVPGDAFSLALALEAIARYGERGAGRDLLDELLRLQRIDGRWTAGKPLMLPDPWNYVHDAANAAVFDPFALFTTATVLHALVAATAPAELQAAHA